MYFSSLLMIQVYHSLQRKSRDFGIISFVKFTKDAKQKLCKLPIDTKNWPRRAPTASRGHKKKPPEFREVTLLVNVFSKQNGNDFLCGFWMAAFSVIKAVAPNESSFAIRQQYFKLIHNATFFLLMV